MYQSDFIEGEEGQEGGNQVGSSGRRRRKRSTVKRTLRNKRQDEQPTEVDMSENRTLVKFLACTHTDICLIWTIQNSERTHTIYSFLHISF